MLRNTVIIFNTYMIISFEFIGDDMWKLSAVGLMCDCV